MWAISRFPRAQLYASIVSTKQRVPAVSFGPPRLRVALADDDDAGAAAGGDPGAEGGGGTEAEQRAARKPALMRADEAPLLGAEASDATVTRRCSDDHDRRCGPDSKRLLFVVVLNDRDLRSGIRPRFVVVQTTYPHALHRYLCCILTRRAAISDVSSCAAP